MMDFSGLVAAHQRGLLALARRLVWDSEDARDVLQLALADAWARRDSLKDSRAAEAWLRRIVVHRAMSCLRRRLLWKAIGALFLVEPEPAPDPDEALARATHLAACPRRAFRHRHPLRAGRPGGPRLRPEMEEPAAAARAHLEPSARPRRHPGGTAMKSLLLALTVVSSAALAQPAPPQPPHHPPSAPMPPPPPPGFFHGPPGIPPPLAAKLGIPPETVARVQQLGFDANEALINLEADLKRAQLELDRALAQNNPDEAATLARLEAISRAELQVRKNRLQLMLRIRKLLGAPLWDKLQAELPMLGELGPGPGRREVRIIRKRDGSGASQEEVHAP